MNIARTFPGIIAAMVAAIVFVTIAATYEAPTPIPASDTGRWNPNATLDPSEVRFLTE